MADYFRDLIAIGPELILCGTLLVVLLVDLWRVGRDRAIVWWIALIVTFLSCLAMVQIGSLYHQEEAIVGGMALLPEFIGLAGIYTLVTVCESYYRGRDEWLPGVIVMIGTVLAGYRLWGIGSDVFSGLSPSTAYWGSLVQEDGLGVFLRAIGLFSLFFCALFAIYYRPFNKGINRHGVSEWLLCLIGATIGGMFLVQTWNMLFLFLSLEMLSLCSYLQAGMLKGDRRSGEASLKYVLYGSMASAFMLFGFSLLYAFTGQLELPAIRDSLVTIWAAGGIGDAEGLLLWVALLGSLTGFAFKISAVPFHFWTPDVYEGSPTPTTAFLAAGSKALSFGILIRFVVLLGDISYGPRILELLAWVAALTMTYGNLAALRQSNLKRLFAYSSIAHAGYMIMGIVALFAITKDTTTGVVTAGALNVDGAKGVLFYLLAYAIMNMGAFGVLIYLANRTGSEEIADIHGLGWKAPVVCGTMVVFLLSLTGVPPTAGFFGKYYLFVAALESGYGWLVVVAGLNTVVSLVYYFRIAKALFLRNEEEAFVDVKVTKVFAFSLVVLALLTLYFGIFAGDATAILQEVGTTLQAR